jgi:hypothetical protein
MSGWSISSHGFGNLPIRLTWTTKPWSWNERSIVFPKSDVAYLNAFVLKLDSDGMWCSCVDQHSALEFRQWITRIEQLSRCVVERWIGPPSLPVLSQTSLVKWLSWIWSSVLGRPTRVSKIWNFTFELSFPQPRRQLGSFKHGAQVVGLSLTSVHAPIASRTLFAATNTL